jgi:hypothetical protein
MKSITKKEMKGLLYRQDLGRFVRSLEKEKDSWNPEDVLHMGFISMSDRVDMILENGAFFDDDVLYELICRVGERALARIENPDPLLVEAIALKRKWLRGEATDEELKATGAAANAAWAADADAWCASGAVRDGRKVWNNKDAMLAAYITVYTPASHSARNVIHSLAQSAAGKRTISVTGRDIPHGPSNSPEWLEWTDAETEKWYEVFVSARDAEYKEILEILWDLSG